MSLELQGFLYAKPIAKEGMSAAGKQWKSVEFVMEMEASSQYPKKAVLTAFKEEVVNKMLGFKVGDEIKVAFNIDAKQHNERWYNSISAWQVSLVSGATASTEQYEYINEVPPIVVNAVVDDTDLPF